MKFRPSYRDPYQDIKRTSAWEGPFEPPPFLTTGEWVVLIITAIIIIIGGLIGN